MMLYYQLHYFLVFYFLATSNFQLLANFFIQWLPDACKLDNISRHLEQQHLPEMGFCRLGCWLFDYIIVSIIIEAPVHVSDVTLKKITIFCFLHKCALDKFSARSFWNIGTLFSNYLSQITSHFNYIIQLISYIKRNLVPTLNIFCAKLRKHYSCFFVPNVGRFFNLLNISFHAAHFLANKCAANSSLFSGVTHGRPWLKGSV